ncbi:uncharacterized protein PAC_06256 [Phialocephala subalpina]|uniref:F-box domain-containing protein n=1 Tax=Phialocephala subalpina TaxID=576137 RepID=A0A1L7WUD1_9HELO|nr:uncharacterized protein PAC_06256 [Phialocephala subalpina]
MSFPRFGLLACELQQEVMRQCDPADLARLVRTSRTMHARGLSILYHRVDISCHNDEGLFLSIYQRSMVQGNNPLRKVEDSRARNFQRRQESFINTMIENSALGLLVIALTWTYQCTFHTWEEAERAQKRMSKGFQSLKRIKMVDICSFNREQHPIIPLAPFQTATSVKIGGRMPYAFFRAIVTASSRLVFLEIDNVQGFGQLRDGLDEELSYISHLASISETEDINGRPLVRHDGPMHGHLSELTGQCTSLRHLVIRTIGQKDATDYRWSRAREEKRYSEIADFIAATSDTLESLIFEQGKEPLEDGKGLPAQGHRNKAERPMDSFFFAHILPVLLNTPWPKLNNIAIHGVDPSRQSGRSSGANLGLSSLHPNDLSSEGMLRDILPKGAGLVWKSRSENTFYLQSENNYIHPFGIYMP